MLFSARTRRLAATVSAACIIFFTTPWKAPAEGTHTKPVRVGYYENEVFQEGARPDAVKNGYAYGYYRKISEYTGWKYRYIYGSFSELYQMLLDGDIDLLAGLAYTKEREGLISYPDEGMGSESLNLIKHDSDTDITAAYETLNGHSIGILNSAMLSSLRSFLKIHHIEANVITFNDYEQLLQAFDTHQIDILAAEGDGAYARRHTQIICTFGQSDYYLCVNIQRPDLLEKLNEAQTALKLEEPNFLSTLRMRYHPGSVANQNFSTGEKKWLDTHTELHVGYLKNYLPYSATDAQGNVTGIVKDMVPEIFTKLGIDGMDIQFIPCTSYSEMIRGITSGTFDIIFPVGGGLYYSEENGIYQSTPVVTTSVTIVFRKNINKEAAGDLEGLHFAINQNNNMQYYYVKSNYPKAEIDFYNSMEACLDALVRGESDCTKINGVRIDLLEKHKYRDLPLRQLPGTDDRGFGVLIGNEGLLKLINRGINMLGSEYIQDKVYHYTQGLFTYSTAEFIQDNIWIFSFIIFAAVFFIIAILLRDSRHSRAIAEAAQSASRSKTVFLNNMSHEIRTPINAVLGMDEIILRESQEESIKEYARNIQTSGKILLSIINDILDFSKIESGKMENIEEEYDIRQTARDLHIMVEQRAEDKGLNFTLDVIGDMPGVLYGDETKIKQCALNLLTNAIKYTKEGSVWASFGFARKDDEHIMLSFSVTDTGIGIKEEDFPKLLRPFERIEENRNRSIEGTGLGLSIVNGLLAQMGSVLCIQSEYGKGSTFSFTLEQCVHSWEQDETFAASKKDGREDAYHGKFQAPEARILVVDDTVMNLKVVQGLLKPTRIQVDTAASADEGLKLAQERKYHIIFIDHYMPEKNGVQMLEELRQDGQSLNQDKICIALTANAVRGAEEFYISSGFQDYLSKPVAPEKLEEMIAAYLPRELLIAREPDAGGGAQGCSGADGAAAPGSDSPVGLFKDVFALDIQAALKNCGSGQLFKDSVGYFLDAIQGNADAIESYAGSGDWKNYTILVHALKSSARLIGAAELSALAADLEAAGNRAQEGESAAVQEIQEQTPRLLTGYRAYSARLGPLCGAAAAAAASAAKTKGLLAEAELKTALTTLKEHIETFDFGTADLIIKELDDFELPEAFRERFARIKKAVFNSDAAAVLKELEA